MAEYFQYFTIQNRIRTLLKHTKTSTYYEQRHLAIHNIYVCLKNIRERFQSTLNENNNEEDLNSIVQYCLCAERKLLTCLIDVTIDKNTLLEYYRIALNMVCFD